MYGGGCSRWSSHDDDIKMWTKLQSSKQHKGGASTTGRREESGGGGGEEEAGRSKGGGGGSGCRELRRSVSMAGMGGRLASAAREQRARLYIMRRCVSMLVRCSSKD